MRFLLALAALGALLAAAAPAEAHIQVASPASITVCIVVLEANVGGLVHWHACNLLPHCIQVGPFVLYGAC